MYTVKKPGKYTNANQNGTVDIDSSTDCEKLHPATLARLLELGVIEKASGKSGAAENKAAPSGNENKSSDLASMKKDELVKYCADNEIEIDPKSKKDDILAAIEAASE